MPTIIVRVDTATKVCFRSMAMERGLTESEFLRAVISLVAGVDDGTDQPVQPAAGKAQVHRMMVRLPLFRRPCGMPKSKAQQGLARISLRAELPDRI